MVCRKMPRLIEQATVIQAAGDKPATHGSFLRRHHAGTQGTILSKLWHAAQP